MQNHILEHLKSLVAFNTVSSMNIQEHQTPYQLFAHVYKHLDTKGYACILFANLHNHASCLLAIPHTLFLKLLNKSQTKLNVLHHSFLLSGHIDVVAFDSEHWQSNPTQIHIADNKVYGRGCVDMKGFVATSLALIDNLYAQNCPNDKLPCLLLTSDEETSMNGACLMSKIWQYANEYAHTDITNHQQNHNSIYNQQADNQQVDNQQVDNQQTIKNNITIEHEYEELRVQDLIIVCNYDLQGNHVQNAISLQQIYDQQNLANNSPISQSCTANLDFIGQTFAIHKLLPIFAQEYFKLIIIGEPTNLDVVYRHKGWQAFEIKFKGKGGHSSAPQLGVNVMPALANTILCLQEYQQQILEEQLAHIPQQERPTLNLGTVQGGSSINSICDSAILSFDIRPTFEMNIAKIEESLSKFLSEQLKVVQGVTMHITHPCRSIDAFSCEHDLVKVQKLLPKQKVQRVAYCTEAPFLSNLGCTIIMGPGNIKQAHKHNEYIQISELLQCFNLLKQLVLNNI